MNKFDIIENLETVEFTSPLPNYIFFNNIHPNANILEIGCGYGRILKFLFSSGYKRLTGIDISNKLISRAKLNFKECHYIVNDFLDLNYEEKYDCIVMCGVIEYFSNQIDRVKLVNKIYKILNENGLVFFESFLFDKHYFFKYFQNYFVLKKFGIIYSNGAKLFHSSSHNIDKLFEKKFYKVNCMKVKFKTWSGVKKMVI